MIQRLCDRCGAAALDFSAPHVLSVPPSSPSTNAIASLVPASITITLAVDGDLCVPCLASALTQFVAQPGAAPLTKPVATALAAVLTTAGV